MHSVERPALARCAVSLQAVDWSSDPSVGGIRLSGHPSSGNHRKARRHVVTVKAAAEANGEFAPSHALPAVSPVRIRNAERRSRHPAGAPGVVARGAR